LKFAINNAIITQVFSQKDLMVFIRKNIRLYPNKSQEALLNQDIGNQRFVWNFFLAKNQEKYKEEKKFLFYSDTSRELKSLKTEKEFLKLGNSQALQQTLRDFEFALKAGFKKQKGFPRFKKKSSGGSLRLPQGCSCENGKLKLPKIGFLKSRGELPESFNSLTILKTPSGKWFVSFVVPFELQEKVEIKSSVGIDLNSKYFVVLSSGYAIENPKFMKKKEIRLKRYQRAYSRKQSGSSNRNKARLKVAVQYEKVKNAQKDFVEQITTNIAKRYDHISIEDLNVKAMQKFNGRMILSAPFGMFRTKMTWKANKFGKTLSVINRFCPTSRVCSGCGQELHLTLKDRFITCDCGLEIHRDYNAALNIHMLGTSKINACGATKKPDDLLGFKWVALKQEAPSLKASRRAG
jgi:putative transposase